VNCTLLYTFSYNLLVLLKTLATLTDQQKEQIRFNTEVIKLLALLLLGAGSGIISLIIDGVDTGREVIFTAGGMIVDVFCIRTIYTRYHAILKMIK
jgi:hypothetical protein